MEIKRILITCENYYPIGGGIQQYIRTFSNKLIERGIEVFIICQSYNDQPPVKDLWGATVHYSPLFTGSMGEPFKVINNYKKIAEFIKSLNVDLVYSNNHNSLAVIKACQHINKPVVYGCHGVGLLCPLKIRFLKPDDDICHNERSYLNCFKCKLKDKSITSNIRWYNIKKNFNLFRKVIYPKVKLYNQAENILSSASSIIGNSTLTAALFKQNSAFGIPLLLEYEEENGFYHVDPSKFKQKYNLDRYLIIPGRLNRIKGQEYALKALQYLDNDIQAVFAGNAGLWMDDMNNLGAYGEKLKSLIEELKLNERIVFTGRLGIDEIRQAYSGAVCTVVPSVWLETFGYVAIESLACETPVVITENCGAAECVDESCAVLVKRKDAKSIAGAVKQIVPLSEKMGKRGRQKLLREFNPDRLVDSTIEIFNNTL